MATLVHPSSAESTTSQLDLFSVLPSQTSLENGNFTEYHPVSVLTYTGPIAFTVSAENSNYIDRYIDTTCKQLSICSSKRDCIRRSGFGKRRANCTRM